MIKIKRLKTKRILSLLIVAVLTFSAAAISAYANTTYKVTFIYPFDTTKREVVEVNQGDKLLKSQWPTEPGDIPANELPDNPNMGCVAGNGKWYVNGEELTDEFVVNKNIVVTAKSHTKKTDENGDTIYAYDAENHWVVCTEGDIPLATVKAHTPDADGKCTVCGMDTAHKCSVSALGNKVETVMPTCVKPGVLEHYVCSVCGKFYTFEGEPSDAAMNEPLDEADLEIPADPNQNPESSVHDFANPDYVSAGSGGHYETCGHGCGLQKTTLKTHSIKDHVCEQCGYNDTHVCSAGSVELIQEKAATCTQAGVKAHYQCQFSDCGKLYAKTESGADLSKELTTAQLVIESSGHQFGDWKTDAQHTDGHYKVCQKCKEETVEAHSYGDWTPDPDILDNANHCRECSVCGNKESVAHPPESQEVAETINPTCTHGTIVKTICKDCKAVIEEAEDNNALGHEPGEDPVYQDNGDGTHAYQCTRCQENVDEPHEPEVNNPDAAQKDQLCVKCGAVIAYHQCANHVELVKEKAATCTEDGNDAYYQCKCGKYYEDATAKVEIEDISDKLHQATGHHFSQKWSSNPDGHYHICEKCGEKDEVIKHISSGPATADKAEICTVCGQVITPALNHKCVNHLTLVPAKAASCAQNGNIAYYQCDCGKYYQDAMASIEITEAETVIQATGHKEQVIPGKAPTCMQPGLSDGKKCSVCGVELEKQNELEKLSHNFANDWSYDAEGHYHICVNECGAKDSVEKHISSGPATETAAETCKVCGYVIKPAPDHQCASFLTHVSAKSANCAEDGNIEYYQCACGKYYEDAAATKELKQEEIIVKATGHQEQVVSGQAATCMESGLSDGKKCLVCGIELEPQTVIEKLPHHYVPYWSFNAEGHYHVCINECGAVDQVIQHTSSGPATEETEETCTVCGYVIAPKLVHDKHELKYVEAVAATETKDGHTAYYECMQCGKLFEDASGKVEITDRASIIIKATGPQAPTDQPIGTLEPVQTTEPPVQSTGPALTEEPTQTPAPAESIVPTLAPAQIDNLAFTESPAPTTMPANENKPIKTSAPAMSPRTGDQADLTLWIALLCVSGIAIVSAVGKKKIIKS